MQKWNIAHRIYGYYDLSPIIRDLGKVKRDGTVKLIKKIISVKEFPMFHPLLRNYKIAIIDFEGSPVSMCGILIQNTIITYYIENPAHKDDLYLVVFRVLKIAKDLTFFAFSDHERIELLSRYRYLQVQGYDVSEFKFIEKFPIINLQRIESKYESLTEAIYSINPNTAILTGDSLFRNNILVNDLFGAQKFEEIISHNRNCLLNESILFQKRWYKNYNI